MESLLEQIEEHIRSGLPFVAYHKPGSGQVESFFQNDASISLDPDLKGSGFVFAPFDRGYTVLFHRDDCKRITANYADLQLPDLRVERENMIPLEDAGARDRHIDLVEQARTYIEEGRALKLVVSRKEEIVAPKSLAVGFQRMISAYPEAFSYLWHHPGIGTWMGATPEILLEVTGDTFRTIALAGTMVDDGREDRKWGKKEREEQQMVTEHIQRELSGIDLKVEGTRTVKAGSLLHLRTDMVGKFSPGHSLAEVISKLHPTAAVCGLPRVEAKAFLLEREGYDREYYTGFLGELHLPGKKNDNKGHSTSQLFVNLRCAKVLKDLERALIFVGGGITASSLPVMEWEETVAKSFIMKKVLRDS